MVFRRKFGRRRLRKPLNRRRRKFGRKTRPQQVYNYKFTTDGGAIASLASRVLTQNAALGHASLYFTLADCPLNSTLTNLYDQYRINKIKLSLIPMSTVNANTGTAAAGPSNSGIMATVLDYDDANALTTLVQYENYSNFKFQPMVSMRTHTRTFKPHVATAAYQGSFAGYENVISPWLDCNSPQVQHYGVKIYLDPYVSANNAQTYQVMCTYWLSFKNVR